MPKKAKKRAKTAKKKKKSGKKGRVGVAKSSDFDDDAVIICSFHSECRNLLNLVGQMAVIYSRYKGGDGGSKN